MALSGWLKLHRALSDHPIASDPQSLSVWVHLLMLANHAETKRQINGRIVTLQPGQLIASRKSLSEKTGVQESKVERVLKMLQTEQQIEQVGTAKYRVISITNWSQYQSGEQVCEQQMNSTRTADEQQMNTPGEVLPDGSTQEGGKGKEKSLGAQGKPERKKTLKASDLVGMGVNEQHAKDWLEVRRTKKAPLTETAMEATIREAGIAGVSIGEAVRICAERGWQGFKAEWLASKPAYGQPMNRQQQVEDQNEEVVRQLREQERLRQQAASGGRQAKPVQDDFLSSGDPIILEGEYVHAD